MIDNIAIDLWSFWNFASMKDMKWRCNSTVDLSKFISNKNILSKFVAKPYPYHSFHQFNFYIAFLFKWLAYFGTFNGVFFFFFFLLDRISFKKLKKKDNKVQNTTAHSRNIEAATSWYMDFQRRYSRFKSPYTQLWMYVIYIFFKQKWKCQTEI